MNPQIMEQIATRLNGDQSDPLMGALLSSMMNSRGGPREDKDLRLRKLKQIARRRREDLAAAETMLRHFANVFGACEICWGRKPECHRCGGHGGPGSAIPISTELLSWAEPALGRLGLRIVSREDSFAQHRPGKPSAKEKNANVR